MIHVQRDDGCYDSWSVRLIKFANWNDIAAKTMPIYPPGIIKYLILLEILKRKQERCNITLQIDVRNPKARNSKLILISASS